MFYPHEYRDLGKGWYAVKLPTERKWTLRRTSSYTDYVKGSIRELEEWLRIREEWRDKP